MGEALPEDGAGRALESARPAGDRAMNHRIADEFERAIDAAVTQLADTAAVDRYGRGGVSA